MPEPQVQGEDMGAILRGSVFLQQAGGEGIVYSLHVPDGPVHLSCDRGLVNQALTNLLKNAAEAIEARLAAEPDGPIGEIHASLAEGADAVTITIADNGTGLPEADRERIMEPYVTTRVKGTGLGLAIVRKIVEQHGGTIDFADARTGDAAPGGTCVTVILPRGRDSVTPPALQTRTRAPAQPQTEPAE
jgi:two-component system nitrogen regulation sensor histidine kinase NtrY